MFGDLKTQMHSYVIELLVYTLFKNSSVLLFYTLSMHMSICLSSKTWAQLSFFVLVSFNSASLLPDNYHAQFPFFLFHHC